MESDYAAAVIVALAVIISGIAGDAYARRNKQKHSWPVWAVAFGIIALISALLKV